MPIPLFFLAMAGLTAVGVFWDRIVHWLSATVADFIGDQFGPQLKSAFLACVSAADRVAVAARRAVAQVFVKADVIFERISGTSVRKQSIAYIRNPNDPRTAIRRTITEEVTEDELPPDLRNKLAQQHRVEGQLTMRQMA